MATIKEERRQSGVIFCNRNFLLLWTGQMASKFAMRITQLSLIWWVLTTTGTPAVLGTLLLFIGIPEVIFGPLAGTYVDRWPRKFFIVGTDIGNGVLVLLLGILLHKQMLSLSLLGFGMFCVGTLMSFFRPAIMSSIPQLVKREQLTQANSLVQMTTTLAGLIGPAVGGVLVGVIGTPWTFMSMGLLYLLSAFTESFISIPPSPGEAKKEKPPFWQDFKEGVNFLKDTRLVRGIFVAFGAVGFFIAPTGTLILPTIVESILQKTSVELGFMVSSISFGLLLTSIYLGTKKKVKNRFPYLFGGLLGFGMVLVLMGLSVGVYASYAKNLTYTLLIGEAFILGIFTGMVSINVLTILQLKIPGNLRGKAMGLAGTIGGGVIPLSQAFFGFALTSIAAHKILFFNGTVVILAAFYLLRLPGVREI